MGIGLLIFGTINAAKFGLFGLFLSGLAVFFLHEVIKETSHRVLVVVAGTLFFAFIGFSQVFNEVVGAMG